MDEAEVQLAQMAEQWDAVLAKSAGDQAVLADWEQSIDSMRRETASPRDRGRWRGGYRTLMQALGIQHREVFLTAGLAWLLDPDGWHGLGSRVLSGLLVQLGLPPAVSYPVRVAVEETRSGGETRADLVVRMPGVTLLIEAVALGWTRGGLLRPSAESWPYTGIKAPGAGKEDAAYDTAKSLLREAAARRLWTESSGRGWVWWNYLPLEASETDLDAYAVRHVEALVDAWKALDSEIHGR